MQIIVQTKIIFVQINMYKNVVTYRKQGDGGDCSSDF